MIRAEVIQFSNHCTLDLAVPLFNSEVLVSLDFVLLKFGGIIFVALTSITSIVRNIPPHLVK